jgi:hypothetical protein
LLKYQWLIAFLFYILVLQKYLKNVGPFVREWDNLLANISKKVIQYPLATAPGNYHTLWKIIRGLLTTPETNFI